MKYIDALKKFNEGKPYKIYKKGTPEYEEVRKIMMSDMPAKAEAKAEAPAKEKKPRKPRAKKGEVAPAEAKPEVKAPKAKAPPKAPKAEGEKKPRVVRKGKAVMVENANAEEAKPRMGKAKAQAGSVPAGMIPQGATAKAVMASKNPEAVLESATNAHLPIVPAEAMVGLKVVKSTKKHLREIERPTLPVMVDKDKPVNAVPFSFQALRNHLGA
jgi:hypothetical protein